VPRLIDDLLVIKRYTRTPRAITSTRMVKEDDQLYTRNTNDKGRWPLYTRNLYM